MFLKSLDLTTALRPLLSSDETLLFVQDAVGLYEGKYKIPNYQNGHAYLTSHRVCYVAVDEPRKYSVALDLKEIDRAEYQAGFLKSSPKITLHPKPAKKNLKSKSAGASPSLSQSPALSSARPQSPSSVLDSPLHKPLAAKLVNATWICPICSFSNPVPSNFDPSTATASTHLPPCLACGIKPPFTTVLKAAIAAAASNEGVQTSTVAHEVGHPTSNGNSDAFSKSGTSISCPRCTFVNHPYLLECEICGAPLAAASPRGPSTGDSYRAESPAPVFEQGSIKNTEVFEIMKLSFRGGGEKTFYERLKGALVQRKWLLYDAPPVPLQPSQSSGSHTLAMPVAAVHDFIPPQPRSPAVGIAGLEQRRLEARRNNEAVIGSSFEDLEALMASAKRIVALAETLARESGMTGGENAAETSAVLSESAAALGMITTKDMLGSGAGSLYLSELSRNLAEYLTDDRKGILQKEGGIMSLIDLWAIFNRARNGVELVSPSDFQKAAELWEKLKLPVRLRRFKSGLLVVQRNDWSDEKTIRQLQEWMEELRQVPPAEPVPWDWRQFGRAVTAQEAAQRFKWSVGVAAEELEMAEDKGILCREEGLEGLRFWCNHFSCGSIAVDTVGMKVSTLTI
ncbi:ESCRT-II subunit protein VPS36 [Aspergillus clavatus NRRL 1]|uniref:Vacuolar protein-sorting-associated protein 36 n=1 Tax=Aspergillus clavatus (strain ATCC 1007 / CBS 513.65 / DSM 816 / NCTC 3887 / NRRL 1 / QM 1276 / 107) TaxID=344612 RepID=A1C958_ASPCL|nr:vacuolar protein sorting protein (Vps36), putative [Aspergillus clavatus NRRL 1]EAW13382.1 vacuolar protein sorting protein (Vps36), putative [Aspergillus clavatus NRRL 1]